MKNAISVRQICFILLAYGAAAKLMIYPAAAANAAGNDLIFPALINLVLQTIVVWSAAYLSSRTDKTFFGLLSDTFGVVVARIIYVLLGLYFLFSAVVPVSEQRLFIHDVFYDTAPTLFIFLAFFFFSVYAGAKKFTTVGRCADLCFIIFIIAAAMIIVMSVGGGEYSNLLPVLKQPFSRIAKASLSGMFRFTESAFLLLFLGHFKYRRGDAAKLTLSYAAGGLIVILLMAAYYATYGALTPSRTFLLNNIAVFFPAVSFVGRIDLIVIYVLDIVILFSIVLYVQASVHCLAVAFGWDNRAALSLIVNAVLLASVFLINNNYSLLRAAAENWFWIPVLIFSYLFPVLAWTLRRRKK